MSEPSSHLENKLNDLEQAVLIELAGCLPPVESRKLVNDISSATVRNRSGHSESVLFDLAGYERPPYTGQKPYSVEASMIDADGAGIWVIAYKDQNERLLELEMMRRDGERVIGAVPASFHCRPNV